MLNYFASPSSEGSYLIADFAVEKVANDAEFDDGAFSLKNPYTDFDKHGQALLDKLK